MSQDEHHEHDGGHELEGLNVMSLFKVIGVSIVLVYASIVGVTQLFYQQRAGIILDNSDYTFLEDQRAQESKMLAGIEGISAEVAKDPKKLVASPPPEGWVHPDDIAAGVTASPRLAPQHRQERRPLRSRRPPRQRPPRSPNRRLRTRAPSPPRQIRLQKSRHV